MDELKSRLEALDDIPFPNVQRHGAASQGIPPPPPRRGSRVVAISLALVIALVGISVTYLAFRDTGPPPVAQPSVPVPHDNGPLWFLGAQGEPAGSGFTSSDVYSLDLEKAAHLVHMPGELGTMTGLAVAPDGEHLVVSNGGEFPPENLYLVRADGSGLAQITEGVHGDVSPAWSPDGTEIVFSSSRCCDTRTSSGGNYELFTVRPDGSDLRRLTNDPDEDATPAWSPDGSRIAFIRFSISGDSNGWHVWTINADGSGERQLTTVLGRFDYGVTWSPDGELLAYTSHFGDGKEWALHVMRADGTRDREIFTCQDQCTSGGSDVAWAPDGQEIAFTVWDGGDRWHLATVRPDGTGFSVLDTGNVNVCCLSWQPLPGAEATGGTG